VFTGLIKHRGVLQGRTDRGITVSCPGLRRELAHGGSVAVNGACLTVAELTHDGFMADLLVDTRENTTLDSLNTGARLNLEPALKAGDSLGGHFVQGHVDGVTQLASQHELQGGHLKLTFKLPEWLKQLVVVRGSIAVDGVSLTIQELATEEFSVSIIPTTRDETTLGALGIGGTVNVEADLIVKTVLAAMRPMGLQGGDIKSKGLDAAALKKMGYGE
jgi:riboflavin synthase